MGRDAKFFRAQQARREASLKDKAIEMGGVPIIGQALVPKDRFGVDIKVNDLIVYRPPFDPVFQVVAVHPVHGGGMPQGAVQIVLALQMPVSVNAAMLQANMIVVGVAEEQEAQPEGMPVTPAGDPPPPPSAEGVTLGVDPATPGADQSQASNAG